MLVVVRILVAVLGESKSLPQHVRYTLASACSEHVTCSGTIQRLAVNTPTSRVFCPDLSLFICRLAFFGPLGVFHADVCKNTMMHNILFAHNQLPAEGCYMMTWSLAVQMQFWFTFPLALLLLQPHKPGFRARLATNVKVAHIGNFIAAGVAVAAAVS